MISLALGAVLLAVLAPDLALHNDARLVDDGRTAVIRHVDLFTPDPQPNLGTAAFGELLNAHPGAVLEACVRSHATKRGALVVSIPRAVGQSVTIPTRVGSHYKTRCAPFTVIPVPTSAPGFVQVANAGVLGRVDYIRRVSIRQP